MRRRTRHRQTTGIIASPLIPPNTEDGTPSSSSSLQTPLPKNITAKVMRSESPKTLGVDQPSRQSVMTH